VRWSKTQSFLALLQYCVVLYLRLIRCRQTATESKIRSGSLTVGSLVCRKVYIYVSWC